MLCQSDSMLLFVNRAKQLPRIPQVSQEVDNVLCGFLEEVFQLQNVFEEHKLIKETREVLLSLDHSMLDSMTGQMTRMDEVVATRLLYACFEEVK